MPSNKKSTNSNKSGISRNIKGKNYELIDIENLVRANKELSKQIELQNQFIKKQDKRIAQGKELSTLDNNIYNNFKQQNIQLEKQLNTNKQIVNNWNRYIKDTFKTPSNKENNINNIMSIATNKYGSSSYANTPKNIVDIFNTSVSNKINNRYAQKTDAIYEKAVESVIDKYKRQKADFSDSEVIKQINNEIQEKTVAEMEKITKQYSRATTVLSVATDVFKEAVNTWVSVFKTGLGNQTSAYENTFEPISVRNGTTRSMYYAAQAELGGVGTSRLGELGLNDNIKTSEIQNMWAKMAENGVKIDMSSEQSRAELTAKAIDLVVTQHIVPYLDTSSQSVQHLNARLGDNFIKQIRGISQANLEMAGNNYMTKDILNSLLEMVQPMSDEALQNLAQGSEELTAYANMLMAPVEEGGQGLSYEQANAVIQKIYKAQRYGNQMLKSDNIQDQLIAVGMLSNNVNPNDMTQLNDMGGIITGTNQFISSLTPGYDSAMNSFMTNEIGQLYGQSYAETWMGLKLNQNGFNANKSVQDTNASAFDVDRWANGKYSDFVNNKNQTNKTLQDTTVENLANELALGEEWMGHWTDVIVKAIESVGAILLTKVVGGAIGKMADSLLGSGGSGGLMALLSGGGVALGAFAAAGGIVLSGLIADGIVKSKTANMGKNTNYYENTGEMNQFIKTDANGNPVELAESAKTLLSYGLDNADSKGWGGNFSDAFNFIGEYKANPLMGWGVSQKDRNQAIFEKEVNLIGAQNLSAEDTAKAILAWLMIADASNVIGDIDGWSTEKIKEAFPQIYNDDGDAAYWVDRIQKWGNFYNPQMSTDAGKTTKYISPTDYSKYHRYGLDYVPYDDYQATLHEGEAVLTASTASELRNLIDEYRNTAQQSVQFDVIIQNQTTALVNKMDEIIRTIGTSGSMFPSSINSEKAQNILNTSMTRMISTRDFSQ